MKRLRKQIKVGDWLKYIEDDMWFVDVYWGKNEFQDCRFYKRITVTPEVYKDKKILKFLIEEAKDDLLATLENVRNGLNAAFK